MRIWPYMSVMLGTVMCSGPAPLRSQSAGGLAAALELDENAGDAPVLANLTYVTSPD